MKKDIYILGAGVTGLAAGMASGFTIFEKAVSPGGICSSYYMRPYGAERFTHSPDDEEVYRFEIGGGHWIFGGDPAILRFMQAVSPMEYYERRSSVYIRVDNLYVPFPLQDNLRSLPDEVISKSLAEISRPQKDFVTMKEWLECAFGPTLCSLFFMPFHQRYTAGLYDRILPQDAYKSPVKLANVIQGSFNRVAPAGYNVTFSYPIAGLNSLVQRMAARCAVRYGKKIEHIDLARKELLFADGGGVDYDMLISTLPLNTMIELTGRPMESEPDPYTSVLVLNIGAVRGDNCPDDHWLYISDSKSYFHRIGFYSNVDLSFLPASARERGDRVSIYVERAYIGGDKPSEGEVTGYAQSVVRELQDWGFIAEPEVVDPTWIDVAYTWSWVGSRWKNEAMRLLEENDIYQIGRYGRWTFQGIAESIRDGFFIGNCFKI
jgi:protoporphyrinogen oxidase